MTQGTQHTHTAPRTGWARIRRVWAIVGATLLVVFLVWEALAMRASATAQTALRSDARVEVKRDEHGVYRFTPMSLGKAVPAGLLFFPGSLVDPIAYAPLARAAAEAGYPVILVPLPRRGFTGFDVAGTLHTALGAIHEDERAHVWVVGGHSLGANLAIRLAADVRALGGRTIGGLLLVGSTLPRDTDLSRWTIPVTKVLGSRDWVAPVSRAEANRAKLPAATKWVVIPGGNHSQFGWYGFQPGDGWASIPRSAQFEQLVNATLETLRVTAEANILR